ncbi:hypothetical protein B6I61_24480, partial [Klebsiella pneumoniae]|uniref:hypothetical protein n=1 Tax=Klebsiella pneumoniae TaxID=573 RepID=UPI000CA742A2
SGILQAISEEKIFTMDGNFFSYFKIEILSIYLAKLCMVISCRIIILHDANSHFLIVQFF